MATRNIFALVLVFYFFAKSECSIVKLNNGGYEDIVIAINPNVKEDLLIIENIKEMVKEATEVLFDATDKKFYIRGVKILIPKSWSKKNYNKPKTETYDKADIIITEPTVQHANDPYTQQYGKCGEPGKYIHLTPEFMTDDWLISAYGPRGRVFVHEWAHLRWGVFDEYSSDNPFYITGKSTVEATRCSAAILGENKIQKCQGTSCKVSPCDPDPKTGLFEAGCLFVPEQFQSVPESLMYMQALPSIIKFCNGSNHNTEAPNMQNKMCNSNSIWDVIMSSDDMKSTNTNPGLSIPVPTITLLQFPDRVVTLVLDVSGSMASYNRIGRLYQAGEVFLIQVIEIDTYVGMVTFSSSSTVKSSLIQIKSDAHRQQLKRLLPTTASGGTNICPGLEAGIQVNKGLSGSSDGTEVILVSDGEDNYDTNLCVPRILASGAIIHVVFLGAAEEPKLKEIAKATGGKTILSTDKLDAQGLIDAFSSISASDGDITKQSIQLESTASSLQPAKCLNGIVFIDSTVGNDTFFLVTWQTAVPNINLEDPKGYIYTAAQFVNDTTSKSSRLAIPGTAERGPWNYSLCNSRSSVETLGLVVNSKASDAKVSPIVVNAHMNQDTNQFPNPMVIYASVSQGLMPVTGAKVTAMIEPVSGAILTLELLDNGAGPDIMKNDGIYSKYFTQFSANGRYGLKVQVENNAKGKSRLVLPKNRALYVPGYIINGTAVMNPPRPEIADEDLNVGEFSRTASGGSFVVSNVPPGGPPPQQDLYKPDTITDLEAKIDNDTIVLSWTATGDDLDQGNASSYDLRISTNPNELRTNFDGSALVNIATLTPLPAGSRETFSFVPQNVVIKNGTVLFFALVAVDKVAKRSDVSNIAQAALLIPPTPAPTTESTTTKLTTTESTTTKLTVDPPSDGLNITEITLIVCAAVVAICIIISITVCIVSCQRRKRNPEVRV
ncbi:calcium-activated chloride channel regulator 1-like [Bufo gargarizans]|uniref:calcium-activated chloride channel regulator 1-like n=1 Tax=Bufo gargarizans TaxID=30331 RepID=UPI001CF51E63|nr:calcium-activated chloride channel regulator 1-like [Bufo gargarizans]